MKTRKQVLLTDILNEVFERIHTFKAQPNMIKEQIEDLIQQNILERVKFGFRYLL